MKKAVTFAPSFRIKAALCCSVALLLTACGGSTDEIDSQQSLAATTSDTMAAASPRTTGAVDAGPEAPESIAQDSTAPDAATQAADNAAAAVAPAVASTPMSNSLAGGGASAPATPAEGSSAPVSNEFSLSGYQDASAAAADPALQGTSAASSADGQQTVQLPAA